MSIKTGTLYIVATPVGNLDDLSPRALQTFRDVDLVAAEDTRHSRKLLSHFDISVPLRAYHDFNEQGSGKFLVNALLAGKDVALISDAGTPLINDPGYKLVRSAHANQIRVVPIPGPSAFVTALSVAGLATDKFVFEGYPPEKQQARIRYLQELRDEKRTLVFYEAPHRIMGFFRDLVTVFGNNRQGTVARELTKKFETVKTAPISEILDWLEQDGDQRKGEFVVLLEGNPANVNRSEVNAERLLALLLGELPLKKAAAIVSEVTGLGKNELYQLGLTIQDK